MTDSPPLSRKIALVTGGASGIGLAIAQTLARLGAQTAIAGRRAEKLEEARRTSAESPGVELHVCSADVADRESVAQLFDWSRRTLGPLDILVNAAGVNVPNRTMAQMRPEQWDAVLAVNATGAYNCMYYALPAMRERQDGLIVNISSISGKRAIALGGVAYCASKFAMTALGVAAGNEENAHGIRITNIYPGEVDTPILLQRPKPVTEEHRARMLLPQDVADIVAAIVQLPQRAHIPELTIKPLSQEFC